MPQTRKCQLERVKLSLSRCSHGPVGRFTYVKSSAEMDRPQAGGYNAW
jgi:hypothetical protein